MSGVPIQPKSRAVTVASRYRPILVGDVRCATTGCGSSWKLSGGRQWSSGADERLEEPPRAPRDAAQDGTRPRRCSAGGLPCRQADPARDEAAPASHSDREGAASQGGVGLERRRRHADRRPRAPAPPPCAGRSPQAEIEAGLRLCRGHASRAGAARDVQAHERAHDGVGHQPRLVGEERDGERRLRPRPPRVRPTLVQVGALGDAAPARDEPGQDRSAAGTTTMARTKHRPHSRWCPGATRPPSRVAKAAGGESVRRRLSSIFQRPMRGMGLRIGRPVASSPRPSDPGQELPVPACPAVLPRRRHQVAGRKLVEELDVGHQAGAREDALEQVVAEEGVLGHAIRHRRLEGVDVVDSFAGEAALPEEVLIDVRHGRGVGVDAGRPREDLAGRARRRAPSASVGRDAGLQHAVAVGSPGRPARSKTGRLSGWAIVPTSGRTDPAAAGCRHRA